MADDDNENEETSQAQQRKMHNSGKADLERVTDYQEEKEIDSKKLDQEALRNLGEKSAKEQEQAAEMERQLATIAVKAEDLELIVNELEVSKDVAERALRQNKGNVVETLRALSA